MRKELGMVAAMIASAVALTAHPVAATENRNTTSACVRGITQGQDYNELNQSLGQSMWDNNAGLKLVSTIGNIGLQAYDFNGNSVCQETANNATSCTFKIGVSNPDIFRVVVSNNNYEPTQFTLCTF